MISSSLSAFKGACQRKILSMEMAQICVWKRAFYSVFLSCVRGWHNRERMCSCCLETGMKRHLWGRTSNLLLEALCTNSCKRRPSQLCLCPEGHSDGCSAVQLFSPFAYYAFFFYIIDSWKLSSVIDWFNSIRTELLSHHLRSASNCFLQAPWGKRLSYCVISSQIQ